MGRHTATTTTRTRIVEREMEIYYRQQAIEDLPLTTPDDHTGEDDPLMVGTPDLAPLAD